MATTEIAPLTSALLDDSGPDARGKFSIAGLSINGVLLFAMSFLVLASGFVRFRPEVMGLSLHPYLVPVALALPFVLMSRLHEFPVRVLVVLLLFAAMYFFSVFNGGDIALGEIFKVGSGLVTVVVCALLVRRRGDFVAGTLGLSIAIALLAVRGLQEDPKGGLDVMEGANKNTYSLFALPPVLLAGYIALNMKTVPQFVKGLLIACALPTLVVIFMGGNRSGYLGALVVGLMLFWDRRGKGLLLVGAVTAIVAFWIVRYGDTTVLDERMRQTVEGNQSDNLRRDILAICLQLGLENPVIGVSPQLIQREIGSRVSSIYHQQRLLDSHNVFAHVFAASGLICFAAFLGIGWTLWTWKPRDGGKIGGREDPLRDARRLVRMFVVLWVVRGMFTREILYNPSFNIALGLVIGLCILAETVRQRRSSPTIAQTRSAPHLSGGMYPAAG